MPLRLGDRNESVRQWRTVMAKRFAGYAKTCGDLPTDTDQFGPRAQMWQKEYQRRTHQDPDGVVSDTDLNALGVPVPARHACLTFSGTWAAPGTGYPSWVAQACPVEEIPVQAPWTFGFIGGAPDAPSYRESVDIGVDRAVQWRLANPTRTHGVGGYSQGGEAASRYRQEFIDGRLAHLEPPIFGYMLGNPCRQDGHTFYNDPNPTKGSGISSFNLAGMGWEWLECAQPGDIYTTKPRGQVGKDMQDVYELAIDLQLNDPVALVQTLIQHALTMVNDLGGPNLLGANLIPGLLIGSLAGLLGDSSTPISAAVQAAMRGLRFIADSPPTRPHITYEFGEALPGLTYIDLARQHVNYWASRIPARQ